MFKGFPSSASGKASVKRRGFDSWIGKIPWRRAWQPTPVFLPGESHGHRSLAGYSPWGSKESDLTEATNHGKLTNHVHEVHGHLNALKYKKFKCLGPSSADVTSLRPSLLCRQPEFLPLASASYMLTAGRKRHQITRSPL